MNTFESELRRRIEVQSGQIEIALAYLKAGQPDYAAQVLEGAQAALVDLATEDKTMQIAIPEAVDPGDWRE